MMALAVVFGCSEVEPYLPKVTFDRLDVRTVSFEDIGTDFVFRVDNPNPIGVDLAEFSYALDLEAVEFLTGDQEGGMSLEPRGSSELTLPVDLVFAQVFETIQATRGEDVVDFGLEGHFGFNSPLGPVRLPYAEEGGFPALRTPRFAPVALRVDGVDLFGADLALDFDVDNDHASTLFFESLDATISLGGEPLLSGLLDDFDVAGATTGRLTVPLRVDFLSAGLTLLDAVLYGGKVDVGFQAGMDVDTPFGVVPLTVDEQALLDLL
jgi:LEA14-like dessication related protein